MENKPTQSNPRPLPATITLLNDLLISLELSLENTETAADDPAFGAVIDRQILLQQTTALQEIRTDLDVDPCDKAAQNNLIRIISLLEKTRARLERAEKSSARQALRELELEHTEHRARPDRDEASNFLRTELAEGERPAHELLAAARTLGIAHRTLNRTKSELGILSRLDRGGTGHKRAWMWSFDPSSASIQPSTLSISA